MTFDAVIGRRGTEISQLFPKVPGMRAMLRRWAVLAAVVIIGGSHAMKSSDSLGVTCYMMLSAAAGLVAICIIQGDLPLPVTLRGWAGFGGVSSWFLARSSPWRRAAGRWRSQSKSLGLHASESGSVHYLPLTIRTPCRPILPAS